MPIILAPATLGGHVFDERENQTGEAGSFLLTEKINGFFPHQCDNILGRITNTWTIKRLSIVLRSSLVTLSWQEKSLKNDTWTYIIFASNFETNQVIFEEELWLAFV